ncbi:uncharacterized protein FA14DRAFT_14144 [Meira miltonrushii]|uniref:Uncharacterized protein n=1 Tax=Meira miltonrushii TaxID=1280837 RepID=A0A316VIT3_9BASI|nr:uncharacterized protein FA14DRAFT_14144 [Meira miltonrushii]PWN37456.1 hypothetical protein FA14DRAFT_14144 [Meira miltonrushii]
MQLFTNLTIFFIVFVSLANASKNGEGSSTSFKDVQDAHKRVRDATLAEDAHHRRTTQQPPASPFSQYAFEEARKTLENQLKKAQDDSQKTTDKFFGKH